MSRLVQNLFQYIGCQKMTYLFNLNISKTVSDKNAPFTAFWLEKQYIFTKIFLKNSSKNQRYMAVAAKN